MRVCLFGDSVLDNTIWLDDPRRNIETQLRAALAEQFGGGAVALRDYTIDGLMAKEMRESPNVQTKLYFSMHRQLYKMPPYRIVDSYERVPYHDVAVLSIGGNDILEALRQHRRDDRDWGAIMDTLRGDIEHAVSCLLQRCWHVILVLPYLPYYSPFIYRLLDITRDELVEVAYLHNRNMRRARRSLGPARVSLLCLATEVDLADLGNYASSPIEPSERLGGRMARQLARHLRGVRAGLSPRCPRLSRRQLRRFVDERLAGGGGSAWDFLRGSRGRRNGYILGVLILTFFAHLFGWTPPRPRGGGTGVR